MESRLRKLLSPRKIHAQRANDVAELDLHSVPYTTAPAQGRLPVFINHALGKASTSKVKSDATSDLRSFSYESTAPGRPPQLGDRPQRGNGPVKLQTSRRLSSGELLVTQQDYDRTLDDIRQGDYILGGKDRRTSQATSNPKSPTQPSQPFDPKLFSNGPSSSRTQPTFASPRWAPPSSMSDDAVFGASAGRHGFGGPGDPVYCGSNSSMVGLGISTPTQPFYPRHMASTSSLLEPHEERNPTIQALWKAEYSRLVSIYGQAGVDRNITQINRDYLNKPLPHIGQQPVPTREDTSYSSIHSFHQALRPLPESARPGLGSRNFAPTPHLEFEYQDDFSERSSDRRHSLLSSSGTSSSFTTRTSMAEDPVTRRDELRKIVDDMRMTYLHALEAHTPPPQPWSDPPLRKPRSKKQTRSLTSSASVESGLRQSKNSRSKSWQSPTTSQHSARSSLLKPSSRRTSSAPGRRTSNLPAAGVASLPAIQASPTRDQIRLKPDEVDVGLKRADSTTLGSMAAKLTILDDRTSSPSFKSSSAAAASTSSPTSSNFSGSEPQHGLETPSPSLSPNPSPAKKASSSVQPTPDRHNPPLSHEPPAPESSWHNGADRLFVDADLDVALDIDHFESLCDGLFNSPTLGDAHLDAFRNWGADERVSHDLLQRDGTYMSTSSPSNSNKHDGVRMSHTD
ncbi:hypothetical protein A1O3_07391 [Capronia epimyces CBS 606.96]|uniref:Uncharacterized protein n=1 Tax=Capronia epimyces CBS 606.96 TaxID=1182542 RepID=W9XLK6_9EURO|nr:uncharacterized protein A1O3_07391 [Capronia epimyces CBS 606.96]EXJ81103.1 hypothetical protein A1O3_07391 [Capronia epimyces CBS 606.96]